MSPARLAFLAALAVGAFGFLHFFVFESIVIASASMEPTLPVGTHAFLDKVATRLREPRRGEIIAFASPDEKGVELIKRVIAVPGDRIELREKRVFLNGVEAVERYVRHRREGERLVGDTMAELTVPRGCLFVLGDNRDESSDSSVWKDPATGAPAPCLKRSRVRGVVRGFF